MACVGTDSRAPLGFVFVCAVYMVDTNICVFITQITSLSKAVCGGQNQLFRANLHALLIFLFCYLS
jgi:hypothetical protein